MLQAQEGKIDAVEDQNRVIAAHDTGEVDARRRGLVVRISDNDGSLGILQDARREGYGYAELLPGGHPQVPDGPERQEQDESVRQDIDSARDDQIKIRVDAGARCRRIPHFVYRSAHEDDGCEVSEVEAGVQADEDLDEAVYKAALDGHENAHDLEEDGELRGQDCRGVEESVGIEELEWSLVSCVHRV